MKTPWAYLIAFVVIYYVVSSYWTGVAKATPAPTPAPGDNGDSGTAEAPGSIPSANLTPAQIIANNQKALAQAEAEKQEAIVLMKQSYKDFYHHIDSSGGYWQGGHYYDNSGAFVPDREKVIGPLIPPPPNPATLEGAGIVGQP